MASIKSAALRYSSFDSRSSTQSHQSDPSSSTELNKPKQSSLKRLIAGSTARRSQSSAAAAEHNSSRAIVKTKSSDVAPVRVKNDENFSAMVKKLIEKRAAKPKKTANLVIPADFIAEDLKKTAKNGSNFSGLHRKLFGKGLGLGSGSGSGSESGSVGSEKKALTEVKSNTRTLAMVLRSERELLNQNKEQIGEITELKMMLEGKNRECTSSNSDFPISHASQLSNPFLSLPLESRKCESCGAAEPGTCEVYADGSICLDILQNQWSPIHIAAILTSIQVKSGLRVIPEYANRWFGALIEKGKVLECAPILTKMGERDPKPDAMSYDIVIRGLCKESNFDMSVELLGQMLRYNVGVTPVLKEFLNEEFGKVGRGEEIERLLAMRGQGYYRPSGPSGPPRMPGPVGA